MRYVHYTCTNKFHHDTVTLDLNENEKAKEKKIYIFADWKKKKKITYLPTHPWKCRVAVRKPKFFSNKKKKEKKFDLPTYPPFGG